MCLRKRGMFEKEGYVFAGCEKKFGCHRWLLILVSRSPLAFSSRHSNFSTMQDIKINVEDMM